MVVIGRPPEGAGLTRSQRALLARVRIAADTLPDRLRLLRDHVQADAAVADLQEVRRWLFDEAGHR